MEFLQFDSLKNIPGLRHAITTRGGTCAGPYDDLNLAYHVGDDAERVTKNRRRLADKFIYDATRLVAAQQTHGANVQVVNKADTGRGALDWDSAIPDCDALIVQDFNVPVLIQVADCAPILLVDPKNHVLAVVHAGWRGAVAHIASETLTKMQDEFGTRAEEARVGIGPCLCEDCFEIGEEVAEAALRLVPQAISHSDDWLKPHLDLRSLLACNLIDCGVMTSNIKVMPHCPRCQNDLLFSHRGQNGIAGRFGLVAWWREL